MSPFRFLLGLTLVFGLAASSRAQSLFVATNTLETGAQTYTFGVITNGATYTLSGAGAVLNVGGNFYVGSNITTPAGIRNGSLIVTNGAVFNQTSGTFNINADGSLSKTSSVLVSGAGFTNASPLNLLSYTGSDSLVINDGSKVQLNGIEMHSGKGYFEISGGSKVLSSDKFRLSYGASKTEYTEMLVTGTGTSLFITNTALNIRGIQVGGLGSAKLTISDGALVTNRQGATFGLWNSSTYAAGSMTGWLNVVSGGVFSNGTVSLGGIVFGNNAGSVGGGVGIGLVSGTGSILHTTGTMVVSGNTNSLGQFVYRSSFAVSNGGFAGANGGLTVGVGDVLVADGGTLEAAGAITMSAGYTGTLSNLNGGILQFNVAAPTIATNDRQIVVSDSVVSFRNRGDAPVVMTSGLSNMTYVGANSLQLNNASNTSVAAYTFSTNLGAYNWAGLRLTGATSGWRSSTVRFDNTAGLLITNTFAAVVGVVTNDGSTRVINSKVTFQGPVVLSGSYFSDPSTNTFNSNLTVTASGSLSGSNGDLFVFNRDFINQSTNRASFNLAFASVLFTNGTGTTNHLFSLTGSDALDKGSNWLGIADLATNFAVGTLSLAAGNTLSITGAMGGGVSNALYVGTLDLQGLTDTNQLASRLWLGINLYYDEHQAGNAYLHGLTYDLPGAGLLIPIPEPSAFATIAAGLGLLAFLRGRRKA